MEKKMWKIEQKVTEISKRKRVAAYARVSVEPIENAAFPIGSD